MTKIVTDGVETELSRENVSDILWGIERWAIDMEDGRDDDAKAVARHLRGLLRKLRVAFEMEER